MNAVTLTPKRKALRAAARRKERAAAAFVEAMRDAHGAGASLAQLREDTGLSRERCRQIVAGTW